MSNEPKYIEVVRLEETTSGTSCYVASNPQLPGCVSQGDTVEEALSNLREAREMVIEHLLSHNLPVPTPRYLSAREEIDA